MTGDRVSGATVVFVPPRRATPPPVGVAAEITVTAPPQPPTPQRGATLARLLPMLLAMLMVAMTLSVYRLGSPAAHNPLFVVFPLMMVVSAISTAVTGRAGHRADFDADRDDYLDYLAGLRATVRDSAAAQRRSLSWWHPHPDALWPLLGGPRMWERQPGDPEFGRIRVGVGSAPPVTRLVAPPEQSPAGSDPVTSAALQRFMDAYASMPALPVTLGLFDRAAVNLAGDRAAARGLARAMICQLAVLHGPDRVRVVAVLGEQHRACWDWLKWLPHHQHPVRDDAAGAARMTYSTFAAALSAVAELAAGPHTVIVVDGVDRAAPDLRLAGVTVLGIGGGAGGVELAVGGSALAVRRAGEPDQMLAQPDCLDLADAVVCARRLAGYRLGVAAGGGTPSWAQLFGVDDVTRIDPTALWRQLKPADRLRVPIGTDTSGTAVYLDIKEAAEGGSGPHGLCIGATGSGKSELLRTIVLGMITRHPPEQLNLVLVDFKGGATFLGMEQARHVAAIITNLADEAALVTRMRDALAGELNRRQELLRAAGNFVNAAAYQEARRAGAQLEPLPALLVIVDEFSELLAQHPDFVDMFVTIGRLGRSLGIHLLLASQRLDEGRLRGLESHLSYRLCLKTLSANESRVALGVADAHELPNRPGAGYLRTGGGELVRFHTAYVSGRCRPNPARDDTAPGVRPFTAAGVGPVSVNELPDTGRCTVVQAVLDGLSGHGSTARPVWLAPLAEAPPLDGLLAARPPQDLVVPIGIIDRPFEQRREPLLVDLRAAAGNVAVVGAPQSGKSTALATLVAALAATHDPLRVQLYGLDFGGGTLMALRDLPHVGTVAGRAEPELVRRMIAELEVTVTGRESLFVAHGIASMRQYRQLRIDHDSEQCASAAARFSDIVLVIDGWAELCREFTELEAAITALAGRGLSFGVHVVLSASRWAEIRPGLRDQLGTRIELRLGDPADSELDRRQAQRVPRDRPGHALIEGGLHALIALPHGVEPVDGSAAPPVPVLPELMHRDSLPAPAGRCVLGVDERRLATVTMDFDRQPHLLVFGDNGCGKTATLRMLCREIVRTAGAQQAQLLVVDYRRGLLDVVGAEHLGGYAVSAAALGALLPTLLTQLAQRMPGPHVTAAQLRDRSWWSGPQLYLLVDDYDLVAAAGNPLTPLIEYLAHAGDIGLHLVIARRSGGAARAMYDPLLTALRDLGAMGLVMSCSVDEGTLIGSVRPVPLPPGRAILVSRAGEQRVQVAWSPPP